MYTKNFEADTMELALQDIKNELGPDAIILKTTMNKGIKGALSGGKKIRITAAISEKSYSDKMKVDKVLDDNQKEKFYRAESGKINKEINKYSVPQASNYGGLGLNRASSVAKAKTKTDSLDDFLEKSPRKDNSVPLTQMAEVVKAEPDATRTKIVNAVDPALQARIEELEAQLQLVLEQRKMSAAIDGNNFDGARKKLESYGLSGHAVRKIIDKAFFDLRNNANAGLETILDYCYEQMAEMTQIAELKDFFGQKNKQNILLCVSSGHSGQSSLCEKVSSSIQDTKLIKFVEQGKKENSFADSFVDSEVIKVCSIREIFAEIESLKSSKFNIVIDFSLEDSDLLELKKLRNGLFNYTEDVKVILSLSSIHSEEYNNKEVRKFKQYLDGLSFNYLDVCSNFSSLFNVSVEAELPMLCFGTGRVVPTDFEQASVERVLGGIIGL